MRSDMDHTVLPANYTMPAFTPQPQSITAPLAGTHFTVPRRVEGWVDLGGWLHTKIKCRLRESNPDTVTHPSTNRSQRRLTSLICRPRTLPVRHTARCTQMYWSLVDAVMTLYVISAILWTIRCSTGNQCNDCNSVCDGVNRAGCVTQHSSVPAVVDLWQELNSRITYSTALQ